MCHKKATAVTRASIFIYTCIRASFAKNRFSLCSTRFSHTYTEKKQKFPLSRRRYALARIHTCILLQRRFASTLPAKVYICTVSYSKTMKGFSARCEFASSYRQRERAHFNSCTLWDMQFLICGISILNFNRLLSNLDKPISQSNIDNVIFCDRYIIFSLDI